MLLLLLALIAVLVMVGSALDTVLHSRPPLVFFVPKLILRVSISSRLLCCRYA
jgi:hypothetical protein